MPHQDATIRFGVWIPLPDGVRLSADLYFPEGAGPWPLVLLRTPYVKESPRFAESALQWAKDGYVAAIVDVRGRGDSEGDFVPYLRDGQDGFDVIAQLAKEPWCTGKVGTVGGSYSGKIQWLTALLRPPALAAMIPLVSPSDEFVESPTGVYGPMNICWFHMTSGRTMQATDHVNWMKVYEHLPLLTLDEAVGREIPNWRAALAHQRFDDFWDRLAYQNRMDQIDVPALHISGWYDDEQIGTPLNYRLAAEKMRSEASRRAQRLLMGPWGHATNRAAKLGEVDFGPEAVIDLHAYQRTFFDRHLKGLDEAAVPRVRIFVMGQNAWRSEEDFPLADAQPTSFYLHSGGRAASRFGDGALSKTPPEAEPPDTYRSDPMRPVPFLTDELSNQIGGPDDYAAVERRDDVLVFTTPPLEEDVEVTGPIEVTLFAATTAKDADFTAKLVDVWPSGFAQRLVDGVVRLRFRHGMADPRPVVPGEIMELRVNLWYLAQVFLKGHAIRLEIASSAFPKYDRNLQTGGDLVSGTEAVLADQTVYHDHDRPSRLTLPIVARHEA